ncbi:MauE/DoxX family redox-associated membrane protein [Hyphomicrobium sp. 99]|uniref:MauE/DoxX family redox-associated membrane protein n=1 Tax=Hyphomicrobium sp. 99 TaxID=1163419 RepID=UPI0006986F72|nr:MauE/DoxX family redox-associated membrane protein [Hyphomicrobium sp. 99]
MLGSMLPVLELFLRILLAIIFAGAAVSKLRNIGEFHGVVRNFKLLPEALDGIFASSLPWVELAIAGFLLVGSGLHRYAGAAAGLLLFVFAIAMAVNIVRGRREIDCGCFRDGLRQELSWLLVARNVVLAAAALFVASQEAPATMAFANVALASAAAAISIVLYFSAVQLQALRQKA